MYTEEQKQQIYKKFIDNGRPWFHIDKSKEPTYEERKIIIEMNEREKNKLKREHELEKRQRPKNEVKVFHRLYGFIKLLIFM